MTLIEEAITYWFGPRCADQEKGCHACDAWAEYDERVVDMQPVEPFGERLIEAATEAITMAKLMRENEELRSEVEKWSRDAVEIAEFAVKLEAQLAEEKALATDASEALEDLILWCKNWDAPFLDDAEFDMDIYQSPVDAYRKARGM